MSTILTVEIPADKLDAMLTPSQEKMLQFLTDVGQNEIEISAPSRPFKSMFRYDSKVPIHAWTKYVQMEDEAKAQLMNLSTLPIVHHHIAAMPDVHFGIGATVGSVIATKKAIIPAAVGVDIGCGMMAVKTSLSAGDLPSNLLPLREAIERAVPHGRTNNGGRGDRGAWENLPGSVSGCWSSSFDERYKKILEKHPQAASKNTVNHLGTLGTGNHFVEVCLDKQDGVWIMLHSGSRGLGNRFGQYFIELAKKDMQHHIQNLPDKDLAYLQEGTDHFRDYIEAVRLAQDFARASRDIMMERTLAAIANSGLVKPFQFYLEAINCHHNYVEAEYHFGEDVYVTRKGAVNASRGTMGIIPGSMGAKSFIVRGKGSEDSFQSCSHGAGRSMSRNKAKKLFTVEDHVKATAGVECRKDADVIDETPMAYKSIEDVMRSQEDLVEIVYELKQIICVKG